MKKTVIVLPIMAISLITLASVNVANIIAGGTVYVVYQSGEGKFDDGTSLKSFAVRQGIRWNRRSNREKPLNNLEPDDDQLKFSGSWSLNGQIISDDYIIDQDIVVTADYIVDTPDYIFSTDSWNVLAKESENGLAYLKEKYNPSYGTFIIQNLNDPTEVAAKTRTVTFNSRKYTVRVIGEGADPQDFDSQTGVFSNPAPLTFQFDEIIDTVPLNTIESHSNNYISSHLRSTLNSETLSLLEKGVRTHIRPVYKKTNEGNGAGGRSSAGEFDIKQDSLFVPSLKEMNASAYNNKFHTDDPAYAFPYAIEEESAGNFVYGYYTAEAHTGNELPSLAKHTYDSAFDQPYWTRSPEVVSPHFTWEIGSDGRFGHNDPGIYADEQAPEDVVMPLGIAPCFCF